MRCNLKDLERVNRIMTDDSIYPFITDDGAVDAQHFSAGPILENDACHVISPNPYSIIIFIPINSVTFDVHINVIKEGRGPKAEEVGEQALQYIFTQTPCEKLICYIPTICQNVYEYSRRMGMKLEGVPKKSFMKNGILHDQYLMGMTKEDWQWRQAQQS